MRDVEKDIRDAFLSAASLKDVGPDDVLMRRIADGLVAALKVYDLVALEVSKTRKPPRSI
jgi:hypothetical protein